MNFLRNVSKTEAAFWLIVMVSLVVLSGCGNFKPKPYLEVGAGYTLDGATDYWLQGDRSWTCDSPTAHFELGLERKRWQLGYHHQSHWACGNPFNDKPEVYQDEIILNYKFGGE